MDLKKIFLFTLLFFTFNMSLHAQVADSLTYRVEMIGAAASREYLPQWIMSNRYGILDDQQFDPLFRAAVKLPLRQHGRFKIGAGLDIITDFNAGQSQLLTLQQGYLKLKYGILEFRGGAIEESYALKSPALSLGNMAISRNARPIPKIILSVPEYAPVPFTKGYAEFKGSFGHGWMEEERYISAPFLHEKSFYLRAGGKLPVNIYGGLLHFALWGGDPPGNRKLPQKFSDFLRVVEGTEASDASAGGEFVNTLGSHLGIFDFGADIRLEKYNITIYSQQPFEDRSGLQQIPLAHDQQVGLHIENRKSRKVISQLLYEYQYTKYQSGPGMPDPAGNQSNYGYDYRGRDDYHNNYLYRSGWTFHGNIIGNPLFLTRQRATSYFSDISKLNNRDDVEIVNNRIVAHHIGMKGFISKKLQYKTLFTYSKNFGSYAGLNNGRFKWESIENPELEYIFKPALKQFYFLAEVTIDSFLHKNLQLKTAAGLDTGEMTKNTGILLTLQWNGSIRLRDQ